MQKQLINHQSMRKNCRQHQWTNICKIQDIPPNTGVCAQFESQQVAIFNLHPENELKSIGNFDPISKTNILSRGIVGEVDGKRVVASPLYKQHFCLDSGQCLQDEQIRVPVYEVRTKNNEVQLRRFDREK